MFGLLDPGDLASLAGVFGSDIVLAAILFAGIAALIALCVPGVLVPAAVTSGAVLGPVGATAVVTLGALLGSQLFFMAARRLGRERMQARLGSRLDRFQRRFAAHGIWYVIGLRLIGAPHFLVTAGSAVMPMRSATFALATLIGLLPVVSIAAAAGSTI